MEKYVLITAPASEPISLNEAKLHLRVSNTLEDSVITNLIIVARQWVENYTWRPLITQTIDVVFDTLESKELIINKSPIQSVTSIKYIDQDGTEQTLDTNKYVVDLLGQPGRIKLDAIPNTKDTLNAYKIRIVCGYANAASVPQLYKSAMLLLIGHLYENKQQVQSQTLSEIPFGIKVLLDSDSNRYIRS